MSLEERIEILEKEQIAIVRTIQIIADSLCTVGDLAEETAELVCDLCDRLNQNKSSAILEKVKKGKFDFKLYKNE